MLARLRQFFAARGVLEVETPVLSAAAVSDPQIESLSTRIAGVAHPFYLSTSPEFPMKRLLASGSGDIYQVCKVFRDAERGRWHNPEFTMVEWYRLGLDEAALMTEVEGLVAELLAPYRRLEPAERLTYAQALRRHAGVDAHGDSEATLERAAAAHGIVLQPGGDPAACGTPGGGPTVPRPLEGRAAVVCRAPDAKPAFHHPADEEGALRHPPDAEAAARRAPDGNPALRHPPDEEAARRAAAQAAARRAADGDPDGAAAALDRDAKLDLLMGLVVGPKLGIERPCFICDYPASQASLARLKPGSPAVAARFELYIDGIELANGFHELANPADQRMRFTRDLATRHARGQVQPPVDERLLAALQAGIPDCAGVALGFDRVVAIALGAAGLAAAMAFTIDNA
ncbi:MAG: EF-P lysine aminoacylase GenX [Pseudomonadota bacterium]|nr:EF-P lysine aminoacylase GenX [Pseudomonadota bacterium]